MVAGGACRGAAPLAKRVLCFIELFIDFLEVFVGSSTLRISRTTGAGRPS